MLVARCVWNRYILRKSRAVFYRVAMCYMRIAGRKLPIGVNSAVLRAERRCLTCVTFGRTCDGPLPCSPFLGISSPFALATLSNHRMGLSKSPTVEKSWIRMLLLLLAAVMAEVWQRKSYARGSSLDGNWRLDRLRTPCWTSRCWRTRRKCEYAATTVRPRRSPSSISWAWNVNPAEVSTPVRCSALLYFFFLLVLLLVFSLRPPSPPCGGGDRGRKTEK